MKRSWMLVVVFLAPSVLSGCIVLGLQGFYDEYWILSDPYVYVTCEDIQGGEFEGAVPRLSEGYYLMDSVELGASPLTLGMGYICEVWDSFYECCGSVYVAPGELIGGGTLGCGKYNTCLQYY